MMNLIEKSYNSVSHGPHLYIINTLAWMMNEGNKYHTQRMKEILYGRDTDTVVRPHCYINILHQAFKVQTSLAQINHLTVTFTHKNVRFEISTSSIIKQQ